MKILSSLRSGEGLLTYLGGTSVQYTNSVHSSLIVIKMSSPSSPLEWSKSFPSHLLLISPLYILPVVLYGCETWSLTLREECMLRVFENRILRRIFGPKRDGNGEWRRLQNEELHSLPFT